MRSSRPGNRKQRIRHDRKSPPHSADWESIDPSTSHYRSTTRRVKKVHALSTRYFNRWPGYIEFSWEDNSTGNWYYSEQAVCVWVQTVVRTKHEGSRQSSLLCYSIILHKGSLMFYFWVVYSSMCSFLLPVSQNALRAFLCSSWLEFSYVES